MTEAVTTRERLGQRYFPAMVAAWGMGAGNFKGKSPSHTTALPDAWLSREVNGESLFPGDTFVKT